MRLLSLLCWSCPRVGHRSPPHPQSGVGLLAIALVGLGAIPAWGGLSSPGSGALAQLLAQTPVQTPAQLPAQTSAAQAADPQPPLPNLAPGVNAQTVDAEDLAPVLVPNGEPDPAADTIDQDSEASPLDSPLESPADSPASDSPAAEDNTEAEEAAAPPLTLERPLEDPLLPGKLKPDQRLTSPEQERLRLGLERIDREAEALYLQGATGEAYRQFFRGLALRQYLPLEDELPALGNVGERAWRDGSAAAVQTITERLMAIEAGMAIAPEAPSLEQRSQLAQAYGQVRAVDGAIAQYEALLAQAADFQAMPNSALPPESGSASPTEAPATPEDAAEAQPLLPTQPAPSLAPLSSQTRQWIETLARLNLARFNYPEAARYTELALAQAQVAPPQATLTIVPAPDLLSPRGGRSLNQAGQSDGQPAALSPRLGSLQPLASPRQLLAQLAYIYEQDQRYAEAALVQQQRLDDYNQPLDLPLRPGLHLAIARNQDLAGQLVAAIASYQETYRQAQLQQQFAISHEALALLAQLYRSQGQLDDALAVYEVLRQVDELSYNLYGLMENQADQAEIYLLQNQRPQAQQAYRQALHLARLLGYREAEFAAKLAQLQQPAEPLEGESEVRPESPEIPQEAPAGEPTSPNEGAS